MAGTELVGRTALVTGASRGIGAAVARRLAIAGARLVLVARTEQALRTLAAELRGDAIVVTCDMRKPDSATLIRRRLDAAGIACPDIIVNNAGAFVLAPAHETSVELFRETLEVNLTAPFGLVHAFLPAMRSRRTGHVVTIGSIADRAAFPGNAAYAASKYGLRALHEVVRAETRGTGIRATLISPGPVDTELWDPIDPDSRDGFTPRAQMLEPAAVADAVHFAVTVSVEINVDELRLSRR
ncbi:MAG: SDR family oxidoreductase [Gemmatimonadaceae bacterium]